MTQGNKNNNTSGAVTAAIVVTADATSRRTTRLTISGTSKEMERANSSITTTPDRCYHHYTDKHCHGNVTHELSPKWLNLMSYCRGWGPKTLRHSLRPTATWPNSVLLINNVRAKGLAGFTSRTMMPSGTFGPYFTRVSMHRSLMLRPCSSIRQNLWSMPRMQTKGPAGRTA